MARVEKPPTSCSEWNGGRCGVPLPAPSSAGSRAAFATESSISEGRTDTVTRVSVDLPVYNAEYLAEALGDLLARATPTWTSSSATTAQPTVPRRSVSTMPRRTVASDTCVTIAIRAPAGTTMRSSRTRVRHAFRWYAYDDRLDPKCIGPAAVLNANSQTILPGRLPRLSTGPAR